MSMAKRKKTKSQSAGVEKMVSKIQMGDAPVFDPSKVRNTEDRDCEFIKALNWYNMMASPKKEKDWAIEYLSSLNATDIPVKAPFKTHKQVLSAVKSLEMDRFDRMGRYMAMKFRGFEGFEWLDNEAQKLLNTLVNVAAIKEAAKQSKTASDTSTAKSPRERAEEKAGEKLAELQAIVDDFITTIADRSKAKDADFFDCAAWIQSEEIKPMIAGMMTHTLKRERDEYTEALESGDKELREAYPLKDTYMKRIVRFYDWILEPITEQSQRKTTTTRKPRKRKAKTPVAMTKAVKYLARSTEVLSNKKEIASVPPSKIIGAKGVVLYNTKTRKLAIVEAEGPDGLSVKGTTLQNFDPKKTSEKKIREIYTDGLVNTVLSKGIRAIRNAYGEIRAKETVPSGRINKDTLILKVL